MLLFLGFFFDFLILLSLVALLGNLAMTLLLREYGIKELLSTWWSWRLTISFEIFLYHKLALILLRLKIFFNEVSIFLILIQKLKRHKHVLCLFIGLPRVSSATSLSSSFLRDSLLRVDVLKQLILNLRDLFVFNLALGLHLLHPHLFLWLLPRLNLWIQRVMISILAAQMSILHLP